MGAAQRGEHGWVCTYIRFIRTQNGKPAQIEMACTDFKESLPPATSKPVATPPSVSAQNMRCATETSWSSPLRPEKPIPLEHKASTTSEAESDDVTK